MSESTSGVRRRDRWRAAVAAVSLSWLTLGAFLAIVSASQANAPGDIIRLQDKADSVDSRIRILEGLNLDHRLTQVEALTSAIDEGRKEERGLMYSVAGGVAGILVLQMLGLRRERSSRGPR